MQKLFDSLFTLLVFLLPHHFLSRILYRLTRSKTGWLKNGQIRIVCQAFDVDLSIAENPDIRAYPTFNAFFTRALKPGARPISEEPTTIVSPVDGKISQLGKIDQQKIFQAKGHHFNLTALLGGDSQRAEPFVDGTFATIYLSPRDYHRIHMPITGTLREMVYIPGRLYPVNDPAVHTVPGLFARNERVAAIFNTEIGPMAMVLVGALFVGSIETVWAGEITPSKIQKREVTQWNYSEKSAKKSNDEIQLQKGAEMGRFNYGSTVILLFGKDAVDLLPKLHTESVVRMGKTIGEIRT